MQIKEVDVRFSKNGKKYTFDAGDLFVNQNDKVVVETSKGTEVATICSKVRFKSSSFAIRIIFFMLLESS